MTTQNEKNKFSPIKFLSGAMYLLDKYWERNLNKQDNERENTTLGDLLESVEKSAINAKLYDYLEIRRASNKAQNEISKLCYDHYKSFKINNIALKSSRAYFLIEAARDIFLQDILKEIRSEQKQLDLINDNTSI